MFMVSKTIKGKEFLYSKRHSILCKNKKQANELSDFLNSHNDTTLGDFKLKENELYHVYDIDEYDDTPMYRLKSTKNKISIVENY